MCGIAGLLGPNGQDLETAHAMAKLLNHRGPDQISAWSEHCNHGGVGFGHTRLSIVDIQGSSQPLHSDNGCVLIFNGEIYNHNKIRKKYSGVYNFHTKGDGEAILAAYENREDDFSWVNLLDGIWAFALWDSQRELLFLSRDRLGVKPLVRTVTDGGNLLFGSEVKSLRGNKEHKPELDLEALVARIAYEYPLDETTLFKDVYSVQPGTIEVWKMSEKGAKIQHLSKWTNNENQSRRESWDPNAGASELLESLTSSVADRLMSDVPLGIILSGGLDSAMIAALANEASERTGYPMPSCWTVAESEDNPDWIAAENVCKSLDIGHHQHLLEEDVFSKSLPDLAWHGEDLDVTVLFFQPLFAKMSESVTVGLCGQGADELHAGYPRYKDLAGHRKLVHSRLSSCEHPFSNSLLSGTINQTGWRGNHNPDVVFSDLQSTLSYEMNHGQLTNFQLRLVDRHSMAHGLEVRVPFLGNSHVNAANELPLSWTLSANSEKLALREAAKLTNLPSDIVNRPKLPAGRATSPTMIDNLLNELQGHAEEYANDIPSISGMFRGQPEISLGLRLFRSLHLTDRGIGRQGKDIMTLLEDVD